MANETRHVWVEDPARFTYLREGVYLTTRARGRIRCPTRLGLLVGYAEVVPTRGPCAYRRRVWWLKPYDRDLEPKGVYRQNWPAEAVDPRSIAVGVPSRRYGDGGDAA